MELENVEYGPSSSSLVIQPEPAALEHGVPLGVLHHDGPGDELQLLALVLDALQEEGEAVARRLRCRRGRQGGTEHLAGRNGKT